MWLGPVRGRSRPRRGRRLLCEVETRLDAQPTSERLFPWELRQAEKTLPKHVCSAGWLCFALQLALGNRLGGVRFTCRLAMQLAVKPARKWAEHSTRGGRRGGDTRPFGMYTGEPPGPHTTKSRSFTSARSAASDASLSDHATVIASPCIGFGESV